MNRPQNKSVTVIMFICGLIAVIYVAVMVAPHIGDNVFELLENTDKVFLHPLQIIIVPATSKCVLLFSLAYISAVVIYFTSKKGYRPGEEYGSAGFGNVKALCQRYSEKPKCNNIILTENFRVGLNTYQHNRNLNFFVLGGPGSGKSRSFVMPNVMQCASADAAPLSLIITDPKGEILRNTGELLKKNGYKVRVMNLYEPWMSDGYNPFVYIRNDDDVLRLVANLWKATTEKGAQKGEQFWGATCFLVKS